MRWKMQDPEATQRKENLERGCRKRLSDTGMSASQAAMDHHSIWTSLIYCNNMHKDRE